MGGAGLQGGFKHREVRGNKKNGKWDGSEDGSGILGGMKDAEGDRPDGALVDSESTSTQLRVGPCSCSSCINLYRGGGDPRGSVRCVPATGETSASSRTDCR